MQSAKFSDVNVHCTVVEFPLVLVTVELIVHISRRLVLKFMPAKKIAFMAAARSSQIFTWVLGNWGESYKVNQAGCNEQLWI